MYYVSSTFVGTWTNDYTPPAPVDIDSAYKWRLKYYHRSGGLKKDMLFGQAESSLQEFEFELNKAGCGAASFTLAFIDFPVDADDYLDIYYNDDRIYHGIVAETPDVRGGEIKLIPQWKRFEELLYNGSFAAKTASEILQTVIEAVDDDSEITWNAAYIDTGSTDTFTVEYEYETVKKIIEDILERLDDRYWGVTADGIFYVRELETTLDEDLFYSDEVAYSDIEFETDYSGVKATRFQVLKKTDGAAETTRIGQVGYAAPYPPLDIETLSRKKEDKLTVSEVLSDAEALDYAYALLQSYRATENITVNNVNLERYFPEIGKLIQVQDKEWKQLTTAVDCESVTGWTGATLDTADYVEGSGSVYFTGSAAGDGMTYNFGRQMRYLLCERIGFMIKSDESGRDLAIKITNGTNLSTGAYSAATFSEGEYSEGGTVDEEQSESYVENTIFIPSAGVWHYVEFDMTDPLVSIEIYFASAPTAACDVHVDRIQVLRPYRKQYQDNIVQINYKVGIYGENVTIKLNSYDPKANDLVFDMEKKINVLEAAIRSS